MYKNFNKKTIFRDRDAAKFWHYYIPQRKLCEALRDRIKANKDSTVLVTGTTGCLSGDTEVKISRAKNTKTWKIKDIYAKMDGYKKVNTRIEFDTTIPIFIRSFNGKEIRLNKVKKIIYSGKKIVYQLTLKNGLKIKATSDHRIMTIDGWRKLCDLRKENLVMCDTPNAEKSTRKRIKLRDIGLSVGPNHPYNIQPNKQIDVHRLIYEASMNKLEFTEYLDILLNEPEQCKTLKFLNPSKDVIHHKDGNHYNNSLENLEKTDASNHSLRHNNYSNFSQGVPKFSEVEIITFIGEEDTYDISCEDPHHNFVANNIVVHNSGKSTLVGKFCFNFFEYMDNIKIDGEKMYTDNNFIVDPEIWASRMIKDKGSVIWQDESRDSISSSSWNTKENKTIVSRKNKNRKRGIASFVILPYENEVVKAFLKHITMWLYIRKRGIAEIYVASNSRKGGSGLSVQRIIDRETKWFKENPRRTVVDPTIHSEYIGSVLFSAFSKSEEKRYNSLVEKHHATGKLSDEEEDKMNSTMDKQELEKQIPLILDEVEEGAIKSKREMWDKLKELTKFDDALLIRHINRHLKIRGFKNFNSFEI